MKRSIPILAAAAFLVPTANATAVIEEPPRTRLSVEAEISCEYDMNKSLWRVRSDSTVNWKKAPEKKGRNTVGHYLLFKTQLWTTEVNATSSRKLATKRYRSSTVKLESNKLPRKYYGARARYNTYDHPAGATFFTKAVVRVVREVDFAPDTTAWKGTYTSPTSIYCNGITGIG